MSQLTLPLTVPLEYAAQDFVTLSCNHNAKKWVDMWPDWPAHALYLYGPASSGKTHLAHVWARASNGFFIDTRGQIDSYKNQHAPAWILDDIDAIRDEQALFHLLHAMQTHQVPLLITSSLYPSALAISLPDVRSRLLALPLVELLPPDDEALTCFVQKLCADRQMHMNAACIRYLLAHTERSFVAVHRLIVRIDDASLMQQRKITLPLIIKCMQST